MSLAVSLLVFYNAFSGSQKSKFGVFERDDKQPKVDSKWIRIKIKILLIKYSNYLFNY